VKQHNDIKQLGHVIYAIVWAMIQCLSLFS